MRYIDPSDPEWNKPSQMLVVVALVIVAVLFMRVALLGLVFVGVLWLVREGMRWFS